MENVNDLYAILERFIIDHVWKGTCHKTSDSGCVLGSNTSDVRKLG